MSKMRLISCSRSFASQKRSSRGDVWDSDRGPSSICPGREKSRQGAKTPRRSWRSWRLGGSSSFLRALLLQRSERLGEAAGVRLLGLRERLQPLGDVVVALFAGLLRHAGVHRLVLVGLAVDGGLQVLLGV